MLLFNKYKLFHVALKCAAVEKVAQISKYFIMQYSKPHVLTIVFEMEICMQEVYCNFASTLRKQD